MPSNGQATTDEQEPWTWGRYVVETRRTRLDVTETDDLLLLAVLGMAGETGEIVDSTKKWLYQGHELDARHLVEELGDVLWYVAALTDALGVRLEDVLEKNIAKLRRRYPDGFDAERSRHRTNDL